MDAKTLFIAAPVALVFVLVLLKYSRSLHNAPETVIVTNKDEADFWPGKEGGGKFTAKDKQAVYKTYNGRCMYCNASVRIGEPDTRGEMLEAVIKNQKEGQFEHIVPDKLGGSDAIENRGLACEQCNIARGIKPTRQMLAWLRKRGKKIYYGKEVEVWNEKF